MRRIKCAFSYKAYTSKGNRPYIACKLGHFIGCTCVGIENCASYMEQEITLDPDWVEFVNATNERYKDANTDV